MKVKALIVLLIISLGLNIGVLVTVGQRFMRFRDFHCEPKGEPGPRLKSRMQKMLGLTDGQVAAFEEGHKAMEKANQPIREQLESKRYELMNLLAQDDVDKAKVYKLLADINALQLKLEKNIVNRSIDIKKTLTPEQKKKFARIFDKGPKPPFECGPGHGRP